MKTKTRYVIAQHQIDQLRVSRTIEAIYAISFIVALGFGGVLLYTIVTYHGVRAMVRFLDTSSRIAELE